MGEIISLNKYKNRKQKRENIAKTTELYAYDEDIDSILNSMSSEISSVPDDPEVVERLKKMEERKKEKRKDFEERYSDILLKASKLSDIDKLYFFAGVMLKLLPSVFHGERNDRFNAYDDFSEFYLSEFDSAYGQYQKMYKKYENEYPFRFPAIQNENTLEKELQDCLEQLTSLASAKNSRKTAKNTIWQACRLFELYHNLLDLFGKQIMMDLDKK